MQAVLNSSAVYTLAALWTTVSPWIILVGTAWVDFYTDFFFNSNCYSTTYSAVVWICACRTMNTEEPCIWRVDWYRFCTVWRVDIPTPALFRGQLYFLDKKPSLIILCARTQGSWHFEGLSKVTVWKMKWNGRCWVQKWARWEVVRQQVKIKVLPALGTSTYQPGRKDCLSFDLNHTSTTPCNMHINTSTHK